MQLPQREGDLTKFPKLFWEEDSTKFPQTTSFTKLLKEMGTCNFPREKRVWLSFPRQFPQPSCLGRKGTWKPHQVAHRTFHLCRELDYDFQVFQFPFSPKTSIPNSLEKVTQWMNVVCSFILQVVIDMVQFYFNFSIDV